MSQFEKVKAIIDNHFYLRSERNPWANNAQGTPPLGHMEALFIDPAWDCRCPDCKVAPTRKWQGQSYNDRSQEMNDFIASEDRLLQCPPKVLGYILKQKIWGQFRVRDVQQLHKNDKSSDPSIFQTKLELDKEYKHMLTV